MSFIYTLYYKISMLKFLSPTGLLPSAPRRTISQVDQDSDDTVYILGCSPDSHYLKRIVRLSLNSLEEGTVIDIPNTLSCGMARIERVCFGFSYIFFNKQVLYLQMDLRQSLEVIICSYTRKGCY